MFTILIPVLKEGYLQSQLKWLSEQRYKEFTVIAMDSFYHKNKYQPWINVKYPFKFYHVPIVHNIRISKRCDYSIKNNLALLSPTKEFIFLSDTSYPSPLFTKIIADSLLKNEGVAFDSYTLLYTAYDANKHTVNLKGVTEHRSNPSILFDRRTFFYVLNGFDEATTYAYEAESIIERLYFAGESVKPITGKLHHILHNPDSNDFGKFWRKPCEKCCNLFPRWKFDLTMDTGEFPKKGDQDYIEQMTSYDRGLGIKVFECPNCGFCGSVNPTKFKELIANDHIIEAPKNMFARRVGRDLSEVYEELGAVDNDIFARLAFLKTTY
jgi:hypothetical protein